ncbi:MAG: hypothetical protein ACQETH_15940 [Candidatus Rifleibacteriota bacterium]
MQCPHCRKNFNGFKIIVKEVFTSWLHYCPHCSKRIEAIHPLNNPAKFTIPAAIVFGALLVGLDILGYSTLTQFFTGLIFFIVISPGVYFFLRNNITLKAYSKPDQAVSAQNLKSDCLKASTVLIAGILMIFIYFFACNYVLGDQKHADTDFKANFTEMKADKLVKVVNYLQKRIKVDLIGSRAILQLCSHSYFLILIPNLTIFFYGLFSKERLGKFFYAYKKTVIANIVFGLLVIAIIWLLKPEKAVEFMKLSAETIKNQNVQELRQIAKTGFETADQTLSSFNFHRSLTRIFGYITICLNVAGLLILSKGIQSGE